MDSLPDWQSTVGKIRGATRLHLGECARLLRGRAVSRLKALQPATYDGVAEWSDDRLRAAAEATDDEYLRLLDAQQEDEAYDEQTEAAVLLAFRIARCLTALTELCRGSVVESVLDAAYELSVTSDADDESLRVELEIALEGRIG